MADINLSGIRGALISQMGRQAGQEFDEYMAGTGAREQRRAADMAYNQQLEQQAREWMERQGDRKSARDIAAKRLEDDERQRLLAENLKSKLPLIETSPKIMNEVLAMTPGYEGVKAVPIYGGTTKDGRVSEYIFWRDGARVATMEPAEIRMTVDQLLVKPTGLGASETTKKDTEFKRAEAARKEEEARKQRFEDRYDEAHTEGTQWLADRMGRSVVKDDLTGAETEINRLTGKPWTNEDWNKVDSIVTRALESSYTSAAQSGGTIPSTQRSVQAILASDAATKAAEDRQIALQRTLSDLEAKILGSSRSVGPAATAADAYAIPRGYAARIPGGIPRGAAAAASAAPAVSRALDIMTSGPRAGSRANYYGPELVNPYQSRF